MIENDFVGDYSMKAYLSNQATKTFLKEVNPTQENKTHILSVNKDKTFQTIIGFGGSFTESATYTLSKMSESQRHDVLKAYFDKDEGLGYTLGRIHMNSSDFSLENYTYVDDNDYTLSSFDVSREKKWVIPAIKDAEKLAGHKISLLMSPWSPPAWMKTNREMNNGGKLKKEFRQVWASYYIKFIEAMEKEGISIDMLTVQNEPAAVQTWDSCIYTADEERDFIKYYLGPTLSQSKYKDVKILGWDHNRDLLVERMSTIYEDKDASKYTWGAGFHWYVSNEHINLKTLHDAYPDKHIIFTEGCIEGGPRPGDYATGERYARNIINDFNHFNEAFIDWNLTLDEQGGPNHVGNYCDAPILCDTQTKTVIKNSSYYHIGHFSKFIKPGAKRIEASLNSYSLLSLAALNPDGSVVIVLMNETEKDEVIETTLNNKTVSFSVPSHSILTFID